MKNLFLALFLLTPFLGLAHGEGVIITIGLQLLLLAFVALFTIFARISNLQKITLGVIYLLFFLDYMGIGIPQLSDILPRKLSTGITALLVYAIIFFVMNLHNYFRTPK